MSVWPYHQPEPVAPNLEARRRGAEDQGGLPLWEHLYPQGVYGHADYVLGREYGTLPERTDDGDAG